MRDNWFAGVVPTPRGEATIAEQILAHCATMRTSGTFDDGTSLCWSPQDLELLAMFAIASKNEVERLRQQIASASSAEYAVGDVIGESSKPTKEVRGSRALLGEIKSALRNHREHALADELITMLRAADSKIPARGDSGETKPTDTQRLDVLEHLLDRVDLWTDGHLVVLRNKSGVSNSFREAADAEIARQRFL